MVTSRIWSLAIIGLLCHTSHAAIPLIINHQGVVRVNSVPFTGTGSFKFGFYNGDTLTWLWTNDGSRIGQLVNNAPLSGLSFAVQNGLYRVPLGDTSISGMTAIPSTTFDTSNVLLRVIFDDGTNGPQTLLPDQLMTASAYAVHAATADVALAIKGHIQGGMITNSGTNPTNGLAISAGTFRSSDNTHTIQVAGLTKLANANWSAGNNAGGLDTGTLAGLSQPTIIYIYAIGDSTGALAGDYLFSLNGAAPNQLPPGYNTYRRIGGRCWNNSKWVPFTLSGGGPDRWVYYHEPGEVVSAETGATTWTTRSVSWYVPTAHSRVVDMTMFANYSGSDFGMYVRPTGSTRDSEQDVLFVRQRVQLSSGSMTSGSIGANGQVIVDASGNFDFVENLASSHTLYWYVRGFQEDLDRD